MKNSNLLPESEDCQIIFLMEEYYQNRRAEIAEAVKNCSIIDPNVAKVNL